uniref:DJ-1/PfpI family protein n=1 Tax=Thaumasiovibrio occultus TaxID=1891184 RepID=UPI000B361B16|nr:DJ-1/PfpI family protein [Thaumasiovibrio occultus]
MQIGILIYDDAEVLDFSGPFEVFSTARRLQPELDWQVALIAPTPDRVQARGGFPVMPHFSITDHPPIDLLCVVGGVHHQAMANPDLIHWIAETASKARWVTSVCTGAFLLAKAGVLTSGKVTTHWEDVAELQALFPALDVIDKGRWVKQGTIVTSAGISAGIDMSLMLVAELASTALAVQTARQMDYTWSPDTDACQGEAQ